MFIQVSCLFKDYDLLINYVVVSDALLQINNTELITSYIINTYERLTALYKVYKH